MKILVIGQDPNLFNKNSESFKRVKKYASLFNEYHIISASPKGFKPLRENNLFLWPTDSRIKILRFFDLLILSKKIIKKFKIDIIDAQDAGEFGLIAYILSRWFRLPFRIQVHTDVFSPYFRGASLKERIRYYLAVFLIPKADCLRVVSERIKNSIISHIAYRI